MIRQGIRKLLFTRFWSAGKEGSWERLPNWYLRWRLAKQLGAWNSAPRRRLREEIAAVGGSALEVGSGLGIEYYGLQRAQVKVAYTGVDVTPRMIAIARRRFPEAHFVLATVEQLPFADESFDTVFAKDVFEHLPDFERGLAEMYRVARRMILVYFFLSLAEDDAIYHTNPDTGFRENRYSRDEVVAFVRNLGARAVEIAPVNGETSGTLLKIVKAPGGPAVGSETATTGGEARS